MSAGAAPAAGTAPDDALLLRVPPELATISSACNAADAHVAARGASERARYALRLVIEELLANVVLHGGARSDVEVLVRAKADGIAVRISDDGTAFDPTSAAPAAAPGSLADAKAGGLGLTMVRSVVRRIAWRRDGGRNVVDAEIAQDDAARKRGGTGAA